MVAVAVVEVRDGLAVLATVRALSNAMVGAVRRGRPKFQ
jgi:hypothetical protein